MTRVSSQRCLEMKSADFVGEKAMDLDQISVRRKNFALPLIKSATVVGILATSPEVKLVRSLSKWRR